jgi:hypothetical protein
MLTGRLHSVLPTIGGEILSRVLDGMPSYVSG